MNEQLPLFTVTPQGVITVDTSAIQGAFEDAYKSALGADLNTDAGTPQGNLILNDTAILTAAQGQVVDIANSMSPYYATGATLDTVGSFFGYYRKGGVGTVVVARLGGISGTVIPAGSLVSDGTYEYATLDGITIPASGTARVEVQNTTVGAIPCPAETLTQIVKPIAGWDTVINETDGTQGYAGESDNEFRARMTQNWLNARARTILGAIWDNIAALPGVVSVWCDENPNNTEKQVDDITMSPHSIYVAVLGGDGAAIAKVLSQQKTLGAATNGNTTVSYIDNDIHYQYSFLIQRPTPVSISVQVEYANNAFTTPDIATTITELLAAYVVANPFKIGQTVSGAALSQAFNGFNQIDLLAVKVRAGTDGDWQDYLDTTISQIAVLATDNISVSQVS